MSPNVKAFLRAIRLGEGTSDPDGYRRIVGGELFSDMSRHPRRRVWIERYQVWSTAAGAYQFIAPTWDGLVRQHGYRDFLPSTQDAAAVELIRGRGALEDVEAGRIRAAIHKCRKEWASLPGSPYGQRTESLDRVLAEYVKHGGQLADETIITESAPMTPILSALIPSVVQAVPALVKVFGDSPTAERNAKAAEIVAEIVTEATQAPNLQGAVEAIQRDPVARQAAEDAISARWYEISEAGGGGIAAARSYSKQVMDSDKPLWKLPAFIVTCMLLPLVYFVVIAVVTSDGFSQDIKSMVVAAIVTGVLTGGIQSMWFGTSWGSQRKDELNRR